MSIMDETILFALSPGRRELQATGEVGIFGGSYELVFPPYLVFPTYSLGHRKGFDVIHI